MKRFLFVLGLSATVAMAQPQLPTRFTAQTFLNPAISTLISSNSIDGTNLLSYGVVTTNIAGMIYTNAFNARVIVATNTSVASQWTGDKVNPFTDVYLWSTRDGLPPFVAVTNTETTLSTSWNPSGMSVFIRLDGQSGANSAVNFTFLPVPDGTTESTAAADKWVVGVTANTTTPVCILTNVPIWRWPGCQKLRLTTVVNTDTDASSRVNIYDVELVGFIP